MNARAIPTDRAITGTAVAHVLCFGENHTELRRGGDMRRGGPTTPIITCPMCMSITHLELSGTTHRIAMPMAKIQALMRTDFLRPKRSRNHMCRNVIGMKRMGSYATKGEEIMMWQLYWYALTDIHQCKRYVEAKGSMYPPPHSLPHTIRIVESKRKSPR